MVTITLCTDQKFMVFKTFLLTEDNLSFEDLLFFQAENSSLTALNIFEPNSRIEDVSCTTGT